MSGSLLKIVRADELPARRRGAVDGRTLEQARAIVDDVRRDGLSAVRRHAERLGDLPSHTGAPLLLQRADMERALDSRPADERAVLERCAARIRAFALAQRSCLTDLRVPIPGGWAGHAATPVERAGCYAPGGRFALPSSVLMTAVTARTAGVRHVVVATPRPGPVMLAAAAIAGADAVLAVGGAQAIAAMALSVDGLGDGRACDIVVGPGNRWVTAAKQLLMGTVAIDMLAGPSELVVLADGSADPALVAADLLAQAEHDDDAVPILVTTDGALAPLVEAELARQLGALPTGPTARAALANGFTVIADGPPQAADICNRLAPEHLQVMLRDPDSVLARLEHYGALFIGPRSAEVLGDYGAGPNHVLPTGGTARWTGGLSVLTFLRVRTWLRIDDERGAPELARDAALLARMEGLEAHARAAEARL